MKFPTSLLKTIAAKLADMFASSNEEDLIKAIDVALKLPTGLVKKRVERLREAYPEATNEELVEKVSDTFISRASWTGGATGAVAFMPGMGTAAGVAATSAQLATFIAHTAYLVLSAAEIKGVDASDKEQRRFLLLAALLGEEGAEMAREQLGRTGSLWAKAAIEKMTGTSGSTLNQVLAKFATKQITKRAGKHLLGRAMPFGIGAVFGYWGTRSMAREVVAGTYGGLELLETRADDIAQINSN